MLANMLKDVLITGEVRLDPATGKISSITIQDIERPAMPDGSPPEEESEPPGLLDGSETDGRFLYIPGVESLRRRCMAVQAPADSSPACSSHMAAIPLSRTASDSPAWCSSRQA